MKLAIVCGCLEPGKDGVGDYTTALAGWCRLQGHQVLAIAINDSFTETFFESEDEIRCPKTTSWSARSLYLQAIFEKFSPDFASLQFVPFAYHDRGVCVQLVAFLKSLKYIPNWQIMFHELWLGLEKNPPFKFKFLGFLQKRYCLKLISSLQPKIIHTHASAYAEVLQNERITARKLPIFSNIGVGDASTSAPIPIRIDDRETKFVGAFFGSLHPEWNPVQLMQKLRHKKCVFLALGRLGRVGSTIWNKFSSDYSQQAEFIQLGELTSAQISMALLQADAGIAATPWNLIEKSGSVAAMIEHGLPVLVTRNDFLPQKHYEPHPFWKSRLHPIWESSFDADCLQKQPPSSNLAAVGNQFLADLKGAQR